MSNLQVTTINQTLVVDSRLVAEELGIEHRALMQTIKKYLTRLERKEPVTFKMDVVKRPQVNQTRKNSTQCGMPVMVSILRFFCYPVMS